MAVRPPRDEATVGSAGLDDGIAEDDVDWLVREFGGGARGGRSHVRLRRRHVASGTASWWMNSVRLKSIGGGLRLRLPEPAPSTTSGRRGSGRRGFVGSGIRNPAAI
jgi:hypothetical protein